MNVFVIPRLFEHENDVVFREVAGVRGVGHRGGLLMCERCIASVLHNILLEQ